MPALSSWLIGRHLIINWICFACMYSMYILYANYGNHCTSDHPWKEGSPTLKEGSPSLRFISRFLPSWLREIFLALVGAWVRGCHKYRIHTNSEGRNIYFNKFLLYTNITNTFLIQPFIHSGESDWVCASLWQKRLSLLVCTRRKADFPPAQPGATTLAPGEACRQKAEACSGANGTWCYFNDLKYPPIQLCYWPGNTWSKCTSG